MNKKNGREGRFDVFYASVFSLISFILLSPSVHASGDELGVEQCMQEKILKSDSTETVGDIRLHCQKILTDTRNIHRESNLRRRELSQEVAFDNPFVISVHKPNYFLPIAKNKETNTAPFIEQYPDEVVEFDDTEIKFQISVKFPLARNLFSKDDDFYFAYTNRSFWQMYKTDSAPFRETNHEPELFYAMKTDWEVFGFKNRKLNLGFVHQSNGRGGILSRSWNRIYALFVLEKGDWTLGFKPWYRIPEKIEEDNNPDIKDYMGNFEFTGIYTHAHHTISAMVRNNLDGSDNRGAVQVDWVFPLAEFFSGYLQYFKGYGESMIDYNYKQESIGIGIALTGWL
ncbi:MAG: phospholipase A [Thiohalomonadales bacterium]